MILKQFYLGCLAHASYVVGDAAAGTAWVIDPQRDIEPYLAYAKEQGLTITDVALTHLHADFVAGHLELRDRLGVRIHLGAEASVGYAVEAAHDGDEHVIGSVRLVAWHTPGHTPEGITWLVYDDAVRRDRPAAALTGDTLFIGDVGRPDLLASAGVDAGSLAGSLYDSVHRLLGLPDEVLVYPAHGAGSLCGRNLSKETVSTLGQERRTNYALQPMSREEFISRVTEQQPPAPAYFAHDVAMNRNEHATGSPGLRALEVEEVLRHRGEGAQILDVRAATAFAAAHWRGAINVGIDGQFAMWAGAVLDPQGGIILIADPGREIEVARRLRRIGFDRVVGYLDGGMIALADRPDLVIGLARYESAVLRQRLAGPEAPVVVDVRNPGERAAGFIPGSLALALPELVRRLSELPVDREIVVHCAGGYRSMIAASVIAASGRRAADLLGGYQAWLALAPAASAR